MTQKKQNADDAKVRQEARKAAEKIERSFPPESSAPVPIAETMRFGTDAIKHFLKTGQDMARFYNGRLAKDIGYMSQFATCRSPSDVANLWAQIASETAHDYADQVDRVMQINLNGLSKRFDSPAE